MRTVTPITRLRLCHGAGRETSRAALETAPEGDLATGAYLRHQVRNVLDRRDDPGGGVVQGPLLTSQTGSERNVAA